MIFIADKGYLLSLLTDTVLIVVGIFGSLYYTGLIGIIALAGWLLLELRRFRIRKQLRPLVIYPAIRLTSVIAFCVMGAAGFILGEISGLSVFDILGYLALLIWWFVALRIYRYQQRKSMLPAEEKKPLKKKAVKKRALKKKKR